jgi:hypothetical protein
MSAENVDDFLAHYGVKGMKWGKRTRNPEKYQKKADRKVAKAQDEYDRLKAQQGRGSKQTRVAKADLKTAKLRAQGAPSLLGAVGGQLARKERYTDSGALQKRNQAGKIAVGAVLTGIAGMGVKAVAASLQESGGNSKAAYGAAIAGTVLSAAGTGLTLASIAKAADASITERNARER